MWTCVKDTPDGRVFVLPVPNSIGLLLEAGAVLSYGGRVRWLEAETLPTCETPSDCGVIPVHINHNLYRYTEQALRDYPDECRRLKLLEEYLCAPAGPSYSGFIMGGESIPEQERILERKFKSEERVRP